MCVCVCGCVCVCVLMCVVAARGIWVIAETHRGRINSLRRGVSPTTSVRQRSNTARPGHQNLASVNHVSLNCRVEGWRVGGGGIPTQRDASRFNFDERPLLTIERLSPLHSVRCRPATLTYDTSGRVVLQSDVDDITAFQRRKKQERRERETCLLFHR